MTPRWLTLHMVKAIHAQAVVDFGGAAGLRDENLLVSALERPRQLLHYGEEPFLFDLATALCAGIVRNHPFVDGNKRVGILAANAFLELNDYRFEPEEADIVTVMWALANGECDESVLARWFRDFSRARK